MRVLFNNSIWGSDLTCDNVNVNYPVDNVKDTRLSKYFRSENTDGVTIKIDLEEETKLNYLAIMNHNFSSTAKLYIVKYDAQSRRVIHGISYGLNAYGLDAYGVLNIDPIEINISDGIILYDFSDETHQFLDIIIYDSDNTDGYIKIGGLYLSDYIQFPAMEQKQTLGRTSTSKKVFSDSGQMYVNRKYNYKSRKADFPFVTWDQAHSIDGLFDYVDYPVLLMLYEGDLTNEPAIYSTIDGDSFVLERNGNVTNPFKTSFNFREIF